MSFFQHPLAVVESSSIGDDTRIWAFAHILPGAHLGCECNVPNPGPYPRSGRNLKARRNAYNGRVLARRTAQVRGLVAGTAASQSTSHWVGSAIVNGFWDSLD